MKNAQWLRNGVFILAAGVAACVSPLGGCATKIPAAANRAALAEAHATVATATPWPARRGMSMAEMTENARDLREISRSRMVIRDGRLIPIVQTLDARVVSIGEYGEGVIVEFERTAADGSSLPDRPRTLQFLSSETQVLQIAPAEGRRTTATVFGAKTLVAGDVVLEVFEPTGAMAGGVPRGVAVYLASVGPQQYETPILSELRSRGWLVLKSVPAGATIRTPEDKVTTGEEAARMARDIADQVDMQLSEWAFAVEAAMEYLDATRPEVRGRPVAVLGTSVGAFAVPATAARLGDRTAGAVVIGGGADIMSILLNSPTLRGATRITPGGGALPPEIRDAMVDAYRRYVRMDPFYTAEFIRSVPALQIHANFDAIVPAANGRLLSEKLGKPERWTLPLGHVGLFWRLPSHAKDIAEWVDKAAEQSGF